MKNGKFLPKLIVVGLLLSAAPQAQSAWYDPIWNWVTSQFTEENMEKAAETAKNPATWLVAAGIIGGAAITRGLWRYLKWNEFNHDWWEEKVLISPEKTEPFYLTTPLFKRRFEYTKKYLDDPTKVEYWITKLENKKPSYHIPYRFFYFNSPWNPNRKKHVKKLLERFFYDNGNVKKKYWKDPLGKASLLQNKKWINTLISKHDKIEKGKEKTGSFLDDSYKIFKTTAKSGYAYAYINSIENRLKKEPMTTFLEEEIKTQWEDIVINYLISGDYYIDRRKFKNLLKEKINWSLYEN